MNERLLLFFFSGLGAFNGLLLSIYFLFFARPKHISNRFLGALLLMLSIRIGKSVFYHFNHDLSKNYLQLGLTACFMIGPFLFLYIKSKTLSWEQHKNGWVYQLLILVLFATFVTVGLFYPYQSYPKIWGSYFYRFIMYEWLTFILAAAYLLVPIFKKTLTLKTKPNYHEIWTISVFWGVFAIWVAYYTSYLTSYIVGALSFSFVLYSSIFVLIAYRGKKEITPSAQKPKYANKKIGDTEAKQLVSQIKQLMDDEKTFTDPNLTLSKLAKQLNISPHLLSQLLNDNLHKSFTQFINEYRIEEAKKILKSNQNLKIEIIAENCGFNSNSTFYNAFKKFTNTTPAKYINSN